MQLLYMESIFTRFIKLWQDPQNLPEGVLAACNIILHVPDDPRLDGYHVHGERWAQDPSFNNKETPMGYWRVEDPIAPGETLLVRPGEWDYDL